MDLTEASKFAQDNDIQLLEASALTGENVEEVFNKVAKIILTKIESGILDKNSMANGV